MGYDVQGKTVLVTGANRGIGRAIVEGALQQGAKKVYAAVRKLESADALVKQFGQRVVPIHLDLEDSQSIYKAAATADDVEVVVNNAGVLDKANPLSEHVLESFEHEVKVNVIGLIHIAQAFAPVLKANGGGALVQLNSVVSMKAFADFATYSASKAASYSITQSLRELLSPQGTQVVSVHPGPIATDMGKQAGLEEIAEPPALVSDSIWQALKDGQFHAYPDSMAKQIGSAYRSFAENVVEAANAEAPA
jgi:NAD(P)-dependent dehydrogenase (short-subunit alcohol dehydrogenase family)